MTIEIIWKLKEDIYSALVNKYDDYTKFYLTEYIYHLTTAKFVMYIKDVKSLINPEITKNFYDQQGSIVFDDSCLSIMGQGEDIITTLENLANKVVYTFDEWELKELVKDYHQLEHVDKYTPVL